MKLTRLAKDFIKSFVRSLGYDFYKLDKKFKIHDAYEPIKPRATYSPWRIDEAFLSLYAEIHANTLVDKYRCYELWSIIEQVKKFEGALIEIGVWRGGTGALIAKKASLCSIKEPVYLCDTFKGVVKATDNDTTYKGGEHENTSRRIVENLLEKLNLQNVIILEGIFPDETASRINRQNFRFCHIDVDTYQSAKDITDWVWDKMAIGGIIVYDDYGFEECDGIAKYVDGQRPDADRLVFHNLNGHAIIVKIK
jgi:O-methyltransferase